MKYYALLFILTLASCTEQNLDFHQYLLNSDSPILKEVLNNEKYQCQIRYTQIDRSDGHITLRHHDIHVDSTLYFYPASTVKMPVAALALEWENYQIRVQPNTTMHHLKDRNPQSIQRIDSCAVEHQPSIATYVQEIFAISDNNAYNRLYELLGAQHINNRLYTCGAFSNSKIVSRVGVSGFDTLENQYVNPIVFLDDNQDTILQITGRKSRFHDHHPYPKNCIKGKGYVDHRDSLVMAPFDMCHKNYISIQDLERILLRIIIPEYFPINERFMLSESSRQILLDAMKSVPSDMTCYQSNKEYTDNYCKFLMYGTTQEIPDHIEIYNKIGLAYGHMTDCAYIRDTMNHVEFFLTATLSVNENQIYNDGQYEYESIGFPFMDALGKAVYEYEREGWK